MNSGLPIQVVNRSAGTGRSAKGLWGTSRWILTVALVAAIAGSAIYWQYGSAIGSQSSSPVALPPVSERSVFALGVLEPRGRVASVAAPSGTGEARIESLRISEGDEVRQGDVLAVLDNEARLKAAVKVAQDRVEQARLQIDRTILEVTTTQAQLAATVAGAQARLKSAEATYQREQALFATNSVSQEDVDRTEAEFKTAHEQLREAEAKLARYEADEGEELIDIELARFEWTAAQSQVEQAEAELETAYVKAPIDGTVLRLNLQPGERIGQTALLELGATDQMMALVEVYESEVTRLHVGQSVVLTASPLKEPLKGTVSSISRFVRRQEIVESTPAANTDARVVEVWVTLEPESSIVASQFVQLQVRAEFLP